MAEEQIVTNIVAKADFSNLIADVTRVTSSLSQMQQELAGANKALSNQIKVINNSFAETLRSTGQYSTHFLTLTSDVEKFGRNLDSGRLKLKDYFRVYQDHQRTSAGLIRDLAKQQTQLQNAVLQPLGRNAQGLMQFNVHVPRGLDLIKNKTNLAKLELQIMNKVIQDGAVQLINWGKNTQWAGRQLTVGLTVPLTLFGKAAADAFKVADQELTRLTKVYGDVAGTSAEELGKVRKEVAETAKQLASSMGVNFAETIALAADIAATGKTGNELLGALTETTRLAVLGEVDRAEAMKATLAIQTAFKQNTEELAQSINFLNAVENQTSTTLNDLVEAIPKAGPVIKGLGGDVQDLALYLTAMREGGISASEGANALKSALASLINPTDVAVGKFQSFGIDLLNIVQSNAGDVTKTLFALQGALDQLDPLQKQQAIEQLFGKFQFSRLNALFNNLGRQGSQTLQVMDLMNESASNLEAVAGRELAAVTESASGKYRRAIEGLKADLAGVGEQFLNISTKLINFVDGIVDFANKLPKPIKSALALVGGLTALAGPLIMLTGVLANFFGYIVKGLSHFKALFKGGEGFRLLTPEILAAERAGNLIEKTFYDDAQAATVLNTALKNLIDSYSVLQAKAASGAFSVAPAISTMANNPIVAASAAGRQVNPNSPFLGPIGTRASAHMNPRDPANPASLFGLVPSTGPVNLKVGRNPMFYAGGDMPSVQGVTSVGGVSAGIYAPEAARWHSLMATLGMQTRQEMEALKNTIAAGGAVSKDIMTTFDDILPLMSNVTDNAAKQTALIVAEMQAGKLTVAQARQRIMALNAQVEAELIQTAQMFAASRGRTIDVTKIPGLDQPVVGLTGESNMRELFKKERTLRMMEALGRATGTKTFGGPYNIATTFPIRRNQGGGIYYNTGDEVPGPNINADVVPAMLTPGEFVIRRDVAQSDPEGMRLLNAGMAQIVPSFNMGGKIPGYFRGGGILRAFAERSRMIGGLRTPNLRPGSTSGPSTISASEVGSGISFGRLYRRSSKIYRDPEFVRYGISPTQQGEFLVHGMTPGFLRRTSGLERAGSSAAIPSNLLGAFGISTSSRAPFLQALPTQFIKNTQKFNDALKTGASASDFRPVTSTDMVSLLLFLKDQGVPPSLALRIARSAANNLNTKISLHNGPITEAVFGRMLNDASFTALRSNFRSNRNRGGKIPRYNYGGTVGRYNYSSIARGYRRGGGIVRSGRRFYGDYQIPGYGSVQFGPAINYEGAGAPTVPVGQLLGSSMGGMSRGRMFGAGAARMGLGMAGWTLGQRLTGGSMMGGMLGGILGDVAGTAAYNGILNYGKAAEGAVNKTNLLKKAYTAFRVLPGPLKLIAGIVAVGAAVKIVNDKINEHRAIIDQGFAPTEDTVKKLNLQFEKTSSVLEKARDNMMAMQQTGQSLFRSNTNLGVSGVSLTIEQFDQLTEKINTDFKDLIEVFNKAKPEEVLAKAEQLKAQFVAGGMSAQEATDFIYTLIKASNDATMALSAISSKGFKSIKNESDAAASAVKTFEYLVNNLNVDQLPDSFDTARVAIDGMIKNLTGAKKANGELRTEAEAFELTMQRLKEQSNLNVDLTFKQLEGLKQQNPVLYGILGNAENLESIYSKIQLYIRGITTDLKSLSTEAANAKLALTLMVESQLASTSGPFKSLALQIKQLEQSSSSEKIIRGVQKTQDAIKKEIDLRKKNIEKIKEEADEKLKALDREQEDEDALLNIRKLQLRYQEELSSGRMQDAAATAIEIQQSVGSRQTELVRRAIEDNANKRIKEEESAIEKLQAELERTQKRVDSANKTAQDSMQKLTKFQDLMARTIQATFFAEGGVTDYEKQIIKELQKELRDAGFGDIAISLGTESRDINVKRRGIVGTQTSQVRKTFEEQLNQAYDSASESVRVYVVNPEDLFGTGEKTQFPTVTTPQGATATTKASGGPIKGYDKAGPISGPGTPTSDSILIRASNGEFMVKASSASNVGEDNMHLINNKGAQGVIEAAIKLMGGINEISKFDKGGGISSKLRNFTKKSFNPKVMMSSALYAGMENSERYLSRRWGANEDASGMSKWGRALGRVAFDSLQGGVSGLPWSKQGFVVGSGAGLVEGLIGLARDGSQFGVKGGSAGFNPNYQEYTAKKVGSDVLLSTGIGLALFGAGSKIGSISKNIKSKAIQSAAERQGIFVLDERLPNMFSYLSELGYLPKTPAKRKFDDALTEYQGLATAISNKSRVYPIIPFIKDEIGETVKINSRLAHMLSIQSENFKGKPFSNLLSALNPKTKPVAFHRGEPGKSPLERGFGVHVLPKSNINTLIHEMGHRQLDMSGGIENLFKGKPFNESGFHEGYADSFVFKLAKAIERGALLGSPTRHLEGVKNPFWGGASYGVGTFGGNNPSDLAYYHLWRTYGSRKNQRGADWLDSYRESVKFMSGDPTLFDWKPTESNINKTANALQIFLGKNNPDALSIGDAYSDRLFKQKNNNLWYLMSGIMDNTYYSSKVPQIYSPSELLQVLESLSVSIPKNQATAEDISSMLQKLITPKETPKFHNWNGVVPGPYNKEISATLKAGTEGVYQQSYINSLKNDTMGGTVINVDNVTMQFSETPANGRQMLAEFKEALRVDNLKKGEVVRI